MTSRPRQIMTAMQMRAAPGIVRPRGGRYPPWVQGAESPTVPAVAAVVPPPSLSRQLWFIQSRGPIRGRTLVKRPCRMSPRSGVAQGVRPAQSQSTGPLERSSGTPLESGPGLIRSGLKLRARTLEGESSSLVPPARKSDLPLSESCRRLSL
jgi:hypothetical protein